MKDPENTIDVRAMRVLMDCTWEAILRQDPTTGAHLAEQLGRGNTTWRVDEDDSGRHALVSVVDGHDLAAVDLRTAIPLDDFL